MIRWLSLHPTITGLVAILYLAFVTFFHDVMQRPAHWAQRQLGAESWNALVVGVFLPVMGAFFFAMYRRLRRHPARRAAATYLAVSLVLAIAAFFTLLQVNIEVVHLPQYAVLACLMLALTQRFSDAMILTTVAGAIDEGWQYFFLHATWGIYYDFNDVILNAIGAGMGLLAVFLLHPEPLRERASRGRFSAVVLATSFIVLVGLALAALGVIETVPLTDSSGWTVTLRRSNPPGQFWLTTHWGQVYHQVQPGFGLATVVGLVLFYSQLDRVRPVASQEDASNSNG